MSYPELTARWWLVPGRERVAQRIDVLKYPDAPEWPLIIQVETWNPWWRQFETLNLSGDVVVSVKDSMGRELMPLRGPCTVAASAELTSLWGTRR